VFLGLGPGAAESTDAWRALLEDLIDRGLGAPLLVISDGGKGLCAAIECSFPASLHQRCLVHVCRNLIAKVPTHAQDQVKRSPAWPTTSTRSWLTCCSRPSTASASATPT
jgi:putative transposase